jgi:ABC-type transport system substrate-binding protein
MKKMFLFALVLLLIAPLVTTQACNSGQATVSPAAGEGQPIYGGILRMITGSGPNIVGYAPMMMGPEDLVSVLPGVEKLLDASADRSQGNGLEPVLAESYEEDIPNHRIVFHIRPGITFHDGSALDADTVIWNFQQLINAGVLQFSDYWAGIKKIDHLAVEIDYTKYSNQLIYSWSFTSMFSKAAWEEASGGDLQKGINWARTHCVGTGPFMLKEYVRDSHMTWVKNPHYWKKGRPYLDGIDMRFIPDSETARIIMEAGQADFWKWGYWRDVEDKGFNLLSGWTGLISSVWPNTADPGSKWHDIRLREAIEYAIDKRAIVDAFGADRFKTIMMLAPPPGEWGYDPDYPAREYNPEKARQLVIDAGYPDGLDAEMLLQAGFEGTALGTTLKQYLGDVGIRVNLDMADPGRFYGTVFGNTPGPDLSVMYSGNDINYLISYMRWFSTDSLANMSYLGHTEEQRKLDEEANAISEIPGQKAITAKLVRYLTDNAMVIPVLWAPLTTVTAPYVHTDWLSRGGVCWHSEETWMEPH